MIFLPTLLVPLALPLVLLLLVLPMLLLLLSQTSEQHQLYRSGRSTC